MLTTVYFVRHGETVYNIEARFQGRVDIPLNERGLMQAATLTRAFEDIDLDVIYTSPLSRARQTAYGVRGARSIPIIDDGSFIEICCGSWEGLTAPEIARLQPCGPELWANDPDRLAIDGGELLSEVEARVKQGFIELLRRDEGRTVAVTSHLMAIHMLITALTDIPRSEVWNMGRMTNGSVSRIDVDPETGCFKIAMWSDEAHIPEELSGRGVRVAGIDSTAEDENVGKYDVKVHYVGREMYAPWLKLY